MVMISREQYDEIVAVAKARENREREKLLELAKATRRAAMPASQAEGRGHQVKPARPVPAG